MVELALASLVFVTVLVFGIHFAEWGYINLKVTEASSSALWDSTAYQHHKWPNDDSPATQAAVGAGLDANARYQDMDGRRSSGTATSLSQVFTKADRMQVSCRMGGGVGFSPHFFTNLAYSDSGAISCASEAQITVIGFPRSFADQSGGGFFKAVNYAPPAIRMCGFGRPMGGGACGPGVQMVLDDWGLTQKRESGICPLIPNIPLVGCALNLPYWQMAGSVFLLNGLGQGVSGTAMAMQVTQRPPPFPSFWPGGENMFWMSHMGEDSLYLQPLPSEAGMLYWGTTPGGLESGLTGMLYLASYAQRSPFRGCFLGRNC